MPKAQDLLGGDAQISGRFLFEVDGIEIGVFRAVRGLQLTVGTEDLAEGGENGFVRKLPGRMSWPNITFRKGVTDSDALFSWINKSSGAGFASAGNKLTRHSGAITVMSFTGDRLRSYALADVFPVSWTGPTFDVDSGAVLEEELEITHHGFVSRAAAGGH
jgi:phage tail-like protein